MVRAEELRLRQRGLGTLLLVEELAVERLLQRDPDHVQRLHLRRVLGRELDRRREHLLTDDPELHRHEDALEGDRRLDRVLVRGRDLLHQPLAVGLPHRDEDDEAEREPRRPCVARGGMRRERDDEDRERRHRADDRGKRDVGLPDPDIERSAVRALQGRLVDAQLDHRELRCGEGEQDAEREERREERDVVAEERRPDYDSRREERRRKDRLWRHVRAPAEAPEAPRQLAVLAERVGEA